MKLATACNEPVCDVLQQFTLSVIFIFTAAVSGFLSLDQRLNSVLLWWVGEREKKSRSPSKIFSVHSKLDNTGITVKTKK